MNINLSMEDINSVILALELQAKENRQAMYQAQEAGDAGLIADTLHMRKHIASLIAKIENETSAHFADSLRDHWRQRAGA